MSFTATRTLQNAAVAAGNGVALGVNEMDTVTFQLTVADTATVTFEGSVDGTTYYALSVTPLAGGAAVTTAAASGIWRGNCGGLTKVRARISAWTAGAVTVVARALNGVGV